eukprot:1151439-Pelagomonas_calceolata.AAC.1
MGAHEQQKQLVIHAAFKNIHAPYSSHPRGQQPPAVAAFVGGHSARCLLGSCLSARSSNGVSLNVECMVHGRWIGIPMSQRLLGSCSSALNSDGVCN